MMIIQTREAKYMCDVVRRIIYTIEVFSQWLPPINLHPRMSYSYLDKTILNLDFRLTF